MSSGGESDTEGQLVAGSGSPKPVIGGGGGDVSEDVMETVSLPAMIMSSSQTGTTSSSGGSGDEGGGGVGGGGRRETKRKLIDALEDFAPKRRSTRVCMKYVPVCVCHICTSTVTLSMVMKLCMLHRVSLFVDEV